MRIFFSGSLTNACLGLMLQAMASHGHGGHHYSSKVTLSSLSCSVCYPHWVYFLVALLSGDLEGLIDLLFLWFLQRLYGPGSLKSYREYSINPHFPSKRRNY